MSWSTFVIGYLRLAGDIDEKTKKQILADFEEALETAPEYKEKTGEYLYTTSTRQTIPSTTPSQTQSLT